MWCLSQHRLHERIDSRPRRDPRLVCSELTIRGQNTAYPYLTHDKTTYAANAHRRADCGGRVRDAQRTFGSVPGQPPLKSGAPVAQRGRGDLSELRKPAPALRRGCRCERHKAAN